ncbi:MAG TPA: hypothetical protein VF310_17800, partial [Vicinamibacteria bacterium]
MCLLALTACGRSSSAPTAAESPSPAPAPATPPPTPAPVGCGLPRGEGNGLACPYERAQFANEMNHAIAKVVNEHPDYFDLSQQESTWSFLVKKPDLYLQAVVTNLQEMGFCAKFDGAEIALKKTNDFNEQYDVFTQKGYRRWGGGAYAATCH